MALKSGNEMEHDESLAGLYREASNEVPPARFDEAIRAAARREAGAGPRSLSRLRAWRVPVSLAAVVVLSATLVLMMREEGADRLETALEPALRAAVAPERPAEPQARSAEAQTPAAPPRAPQSPVRPPAADIPPPAPLAAPQAEQKVLAGNAGPALPEAPPEPRREVAAMADAARPMMRAAPAPAAADAAAGRIARSAPAASTAAVASAVPPLWQDLIDQPADKWVQRILEWQRAGRSADAETLVREFVRRFPDQPLPAEIRKP
jgi:hypothetical protein